MSTALAHIDGGCRPTNPGHAAFAVVIEIGGREEILSRYIGWASNNIAEYTALIVAVKYARHLGAEALEVVSDSRLVVEQVHGRWRVRNDSIRSYQREARDLLFKLFPSAWTLNWASRKDNVKADYYCGLAVNYGRNLNPWIPSSIKDKRPGKIIDPFSSPGKR